jgi:hypothetical protein
VQHLKIHRIGNILGLEQNVPGPARDPFVHFDPSELRILVTGVPEAGHEHPLEDRIGAGKPGVGLFELFCSDTEFEQRPEHRGKKARALRMSDRFR